MLKIVYRVCCGMDVHKSFVVACIAAANEQGVTTCKSKRFSTFTGDLRRCAAWLAENNCKDVCMESTGKYCTHQGSMVPSSGVSQRQYCRHSNTRKATPMMANFTPRETKANCHSHRMMALAFPDCLGRLNKKTPPKQKGPTQLRPSSIWNPASTVGVIPLCCPHLHRYYL